MIRGIPPVTGLNAHRKITSSKKTQKDEGLEWRARRRPRQWIYETKPFFKKVKEPLIDVFKEAKEVKIVIDLCSFSRGEVDIDIKPDKYIIFAKRGDQEFRQEIDLPLDVDIENTAENFKNGILEITLPRKKDKHKIKRVVNLFRQKGPR